MGIRELCIKALAVIVCVAVVTAAYGREMLVNMEEKSEPAAKSVLDKSHKSNRSAAEEAELNAIDKRRNSILSRDSEKIPFLVKGIKYNCIKNEDLILLYNGNQKLIYSISDDVCLYFVYNCNVGEKRLKEDDLRDKAKEALSKAFSQKGSFNVEEISLLTACSDHSTYSFKVDIYDKSFVIVSVRADNGNVICFQICELWEKYSADIGRLAGV